MTADRADLGQLQSWDAPPPGFSESCLRQRAEGYLLSLPCPGQLHGLCHGLQGTKDHPNGPAQLQNSSIHVDGGGKESRREGESPRLGGLGAVSAQKDDSWGWM